MYAFMRDIPVIRLQKKQMEKYHVKASYLLLTKKNMAPELHPDEPKKKRVHVLYTATAEHEETVTHTRVGS